jgi:hypothetical protein
MEVRFRYRPRLSPEGCHLLKTLRLGQVFLKISIESLYLL